MFRKINPRKIYDGARQSLKSPPKVYALALLECRVCVHYAVEKVDIQRG